MTDMRSFMCLPLLMCAHLVSNPLPVFASCVASDHPVQGAASRTAKPCLVVAPCRQDPKVALSNFGNSSTPRAIGERHRSTPSKLRIGSTNGESLVDLPGTPTGLQVRPVLLC